MRKFFYFLISSSLLLSMPVEYHLAYAAPTSPPYTTSWYMKTVDATTLYNMGCALGTHDKNTPGTQDNVVILDYGQPWVQNSTYGTLMWKTGGGTQFVTTTQIANAAEQFGKGYWVCTGSADTTSQLYLAIGTSNYGGYVNSGHGTAWAQMVNLVNSWFSTYGYTSQVKARGAIDIELEWNSPSVTRTWVDGYTSAWQYPFYNFGDASGCPSPTYPNWDCGTSQYPGWTSEDVWYVSWGASPAYPLPEIYRTDGLNAGQWYYLSLYSYTNHGGRMTLMGAVTQYQACQQRGGCTGTNNTPSQGWSQLWDALNADTRTAQSLRWSTDMKWYGE